MKLPTFTFSVPWRVVLPIAGTAVASIGLFSYRLASLAPQLSPLEQRLYDGTANPSALLDNPFFFPVKLLFWLAHYAPAGMHIQATRLPSVLAALVAVGLIALILHRWYGMRSMAFGMVLFACSAWMLHIGRFAGFDIVYAAAMLLLLAIHIGLHDHEDSSLMWLLWLAADLLLLFVPGMIWFVLISIVWQWRALWAAWQATNLPQRIASAVATVLAVAGLAYTFIRTPALLFTWLGIPNHLSGLRHLHWDILHTLLALVYRSPEHPEHWLGTLPLFDLATLLFFVAGIAFYAFHWRASRTHQLGSFLALGIVLASLGKIGISLIVPLVYIIAVGGIAYVLHFWMRTFPRNPIARALGIGVVMAVVALSCYYNLVQYFVAWPHNPAVAAVYHSQK